MKITHENFILTLTHCVNEFTIVLSKLREIEMDTPETHEELLHLDDMFNDAGEYLPDIMQYIENEEPDASIVGDKLKMAVNLTTAILKEKKRIIVNEMKVLMNKNDTFLN